MSIDLTSKRLAAPNAAPSPRGMVMPKVLTGLILASSLTLVATSARAQVTGYAVNHFEPSERGSEWFVMESLDIRGHVRPALGVVGEWAYRPLVITAPDGHVVKSIVRDQAFVHPGASL